MGELRRRDVLTLAGRLAAATAVAGLGVRGAALAAGQGTSSARDGRDAGLGRPLRIGYLPITDASALLTAHERGLFAEFGVPSAKPVLMRNWESLAQAFVVGEVDVVHLLVPFAVQLRLAQAHAFSLVAWGHTNGSALTVAPSVTATEQLAGSTVAIPYWWSIHNVLLQQVLSRAGLRPVIRQRASAADRTVELVVMAPADMVPALASRTIAGFVVADPFSAVAEAKGVGRVHRFLGDVWRQHACCGIAVRGDLIDRNPAAVQGITDAVVAAQRWLDGHRPDAGTLLTSGGGYLPQPPAAVSAVFTRRQAAYQQVLSHPDWHGETLSFSAYPQPSFTRSLVDLMRQTVVDGDRSFLDAVPPEAAHARVFDDRFIRRSLVSAGQAVPTTRTEDIAP